MPTYVKMQFQPYQNTQELTIFLDSRKTDVYKENVADNFRFLLTRDIRFERCEIALNSITFRNNFKIMSDLALGFDVEHYSGDLVTKTEQFQIPRTLQNHDDIVNYFLKKIQHVADHEKTDNGTLKLIFKSKTKLVIQEHLAEILGSSVIKQICVIRKLKGDTYVFQFTPKKIPIFPNQLYITCSFIQPTLVAEVLCPLLKIIPISADNNDDFLSIDFSHNELEFIPCRFNNLKELQFEIFTHTMKNIGFMNPHDVLYMSIVLRKF